ncbi:hypothetical protein VTO73DRAFT_42 [Trametes versicolor]
MVVDVAEELPGWDLGHMACLPESTADPGSAQSLRELQASLRHVLEVTHRRHPRISPECYKHSRARRRSPRRGTAWSPIFSPTRTCRPYPAKTLARRIPSWTRDACRNLPRRRNSLTTPQTAHARRRHDTAHSTSECANTSPERVRASARNDSRVEAEWQRVETMQFREVPD